MQNKLKIPPESKKKEKDLVIFRGGWCRLDTRPYNHIGIFIRKTEINYIYMYI